MATVDYRSLAGDILQGVNVETNIASTSHCATRLRLKLRDDAKADTAAIEKLPGVITVMKAGGRWQTTCDSARAPKLAVKATRQRCGDNIAT